MTSFHDLVLSPISQHSDWNELTSPLQWSVTKRSHSSVWLARRNTTGRFSRSGSHTMHQTLWQYFDGNLF